MLDRLQEAKHAFLLDGVSSSHYQKDQSFEVPT